MTVCWGTAVRAWTLCYCCFFPSLLAVLFFVMCYHFQVFTSLSLSFALWERETFSVSIIAPDGPWPLRMLISLTGVFRLVFSLSPSPPEIIPRCFTSSGMRTNTTQQRVTAYCICLGFFICCSHCIEQSLASTSLCLANFYSFFASHPFLESQRVLCVPPLCCNAVIVFIRI